MNEDLKALIDTYYSLADAMAAQGDRKSVV